MDLSGEVLIPSSLAAEEIELFRFSDRLGKSLVGLGPFGFSVGVSALFVAVVVSIVSVGIIIF